MFTDFSLDKSKVRQSFSNAAKTYDDLAGLQRKVGLALLNMIDNDHKINTESIADIGCGTGFLTREIQSVLLPKNLLAVDIALPMVQTTQSKLSHLKNVQYICADAEFLPLPDHSIDQIYSSLALQWCQNLDAVFSGFKQSLKPNGQMYFSTFGAKTLKELKQAWAEVDDYQHVNDFYTKNELIDFLAQSGFRHIKVEVKNYPSNYPSVMALMRELKGIGAHNVLSGRHKGFTGKDKMRKMIAAYEKNQLTTSVSATYEVIFVSASTST